MGAITLCEQISSTDFDDWLIVSIKAYDKPAAELNFIDVRHSYLLVTLQNPNKVHKSCCQALMDCWLGCCLFRCMGCLVGCLTCTCCCTCCRKSTELEEALYSSSVTVLLELTGSMTKGAFLRQSFYQFSETLNETDREMLMSSLPKIEECLDREQLILECSYKGNLRYGDLRKALVSKFIKTKYDIKSNNCFNFVICGFDSIGLNSTIIQRRMALVQQNVRKHHIVVPTLERMIT